MADACARSRASPSPRPRPASSAPRTAPGSGEKVASRGFHLSTGFLGTPDLLPALTDTGNLDIAYRLLLNRDYPLVGLRDRARGHHDLERWDSIKPDGSFGDVSMNSFNHYAYGAVGDWMYRTIGGIRPDDAAPGYRHVTIAPRPGGDLTSAPAAYRSGTAGS